MRKFTQLTRMEQVQPEPFVLDKVPLWSSLTRGSSSLRLWRGSLASLLVCGPCCTAPFPSCPQQRLKWSACEVRRCQAHRTLPPCLATAAPPPPVTGNPGKKTFVFVFLSVYPHYSGPLSPPWDCMTSESQWKAQGSQKTPILT